MRKYQQLLLIITSLVSISLLLIYRHEYNRLHYVLEVFNFFGQPNNDCSYSELLNITNTLHHDWGPKPVWTTEQNFTIYSAFLKTDNDIEALIIHNDNNVAIKACFLWFESNLNPETGNVNYFKIKKINEKINLSFYKYNCHIDNYAEPPYAVSFANSNKISKELKRIILHPIPKKKYDFTTVCVVPSVEYSKQQIVEFISFYKVIGFDSFIIYNNNIPYKFMYLLQKISLKLGLEIENLPWNFPFPINSDIRSIIEEDCLLRTREKSKSVVILDFKEFIVPKYHFTLSALLDSYDPTNRTNRFGLKVVVFCTDDNNNNKIRDREPSMFHNVYYEVTKAVEYLYIHRNNVAQSNSVINTQEISESLGAIHRYVPCNSKLSDKIDSNILRFAKDLRKSTLFKLFKYDKLK